MESPPACPSSECLGERFSPQLTDRTVTTITDSPIHEAPTKQRAPPDPTDPPPQYGYTDREDPNWLPLWLHRGALIAFSILCIFVVAATIALLLISNKQNGFNLITTNHYAWTYGPTTCLILLTALWRQVDFYCKALTPWAVLEREETPASESMLLDYVSPIRWNTLRKAYKNKHHAVVLSMISFGALKLLVLASTALFMPHTISEIHNNVSVTKTSFKQGLDSSGNTTSGLFQPTIAYEAFAIAAKGLAPSLGSTEDVAYETVKFPPEVQRANTTLSTTVRVFVPQFECQRALFGISPQPVNASDSHPPDQIVLSSSNCTLSATGTRKPLYVLDPEILKTPDRQLSPLRQQINCSDSHDHWQLLTLVDFRYNQTFGNDGVLAEIGDTIRATSWSTEVVQAIGIACRSSYWLEDARLEYRPASDSITVEQLGTNRGKLANFTDFDLGALTESVMSNASGVFGLQLDNAFAEEYPDILFKMMAQLVNGTYDQLFNETAMTQAAQTTYNQIAIQAVREYLAGGRSAPIEALLTFQEDRLVVSEPVAMVFIIGGLIVVALVLGVALFRPNPGTLQNPELTATVAAVLVRSDEVQTLIDKTHTGGKDLKECLADHHFRSEIIENEGDFEQRINAFSLLPPRESVYSQGSDPGAPLQWTWYRPGTMKCSFLLMSLLLAVVMVGLLEMLQQRSDSRGGILKVSNPDNPGIALLPQLFSALFMMLVATNSDSLEFDILSLAPFERLRTRYAASPGGLLTTYLGRTPPIVLCVAFFLQHWAVILISFTALIGGLLTLIASGLYTFHSSLPESSSKMLQLDSFQTNWNGSVANDNGAAVVTSLIESSNLSYPAFTYSELALPLVAGVDTIEGAGADTLLEVKVPAARASLECTPLRQDAFSFSASFNPNIKTYSSFISARLPLPSRCRRGGPSGNLSFLEFDHSFTFASNTSYVAKLLDVHVGPWAAGLASGAGELNPTSQQDNPAECPTLAFVYGYADTRDASKTIANVLSCYQRIDEITTDVTFTALNMSLSTIHPPITNESTANPMISPSTHSINYPFRIQPHFDQSFVSNVQFQNPSHPCAFDDPSANISAEVLTSPNPPIDPFFQGVLCGTPYLPLTAFRSNSNASTAQVLNSIQGLYRRYMAQAISSNMRQKLPRSEISSQSTYPLIPTAILKNTIPETQLIQHRTPKIILQCMLSTMIILSGFAIYISRLWEPIVPCNPCTIAGTMLLFAESEMTNPTSEACQRLFPRGVQGMSKRELRRHWQEQGWEFKLGWWDSRNGRRWGIEAVRVARGMRGAGV